MQSGVTLKEIESSINQLRNIHPSHVTTEKIKLLCAKQKGRTDTSFNILISKTIDIEHYSKNTYKRTIRCFKQNTFIKEKKYDSV